MKLVSPAHAPQLLALVQPHLAGADARHQVRFRALVALISHSAEGTVTRAAVSQALYPGLTADSIKSDLAVFKTALALAADKAGLGKLLLASPRGRGGPNQLLWLELEAHLQPEVPAGTQLATSFISQQTSIAAHALDLSPLQVAVSFAGVDQALADSLLAELKTGLRARRSDVAGRIAFWTFRSTIGDDGIRAGKNDHQAIQAEFKRSAAGLLLVSPSACASAYIQKEEWPLFRAPKGKVRKPFLGVMLAPVDERKHQLGVLGRAESGNRTQLLYLLADGKNLAWDQCLNNPAHRREFAEKLIDQLLQSITDSLPPPPKAPASSSPCAAPPDPSKAAKAGKTSKAAKAHQARHFEADAAATVPGRGLPVGLQPGGGARPRTPDNDADAASSPDGGVEIVPAMVTWAGDATDTPFAVLLGEYGMGKTWNSQLLAQALEQRIKHPPPDEGGTPTPIYLDLRKTIEDKNALLGGDLPTLERFLDLLNARNTPPGQQAPTGRDTLKAVQQEGALLIFDGLDEVLAHHRDEAWGQQFINLLFSALPFSHWPRHLNPASVSPSPGKLLLTCRTHYFKSTQTQNQQILGVGREQHPAAAPRAWQMLPFTEGQVLDYLGRHLPGQDPQAVYALIGSVHNLAEVTSRPQGLKMVCGQIARIEQAQRDGQVVNGASIYAWMVQAWLTRDVGKHQLLEEDKATLMQDLALHLWQRNARQIRWDPLATWFRAWLRLDPVRSATPQYQKATETALLTDLRNATFLVRPGESEFAFAHTSILEYFLALRLHRSLELDQPEVWEDLDPSPETLLFLNQHQQTSDDATQAQVRRTLQKWLALAGTSGEVARLSWLDLSELSPKAWNLAQLDISGMDLEQHVFSGLRLDTLRADGARLVETEWTDCRFTQSSWVGTDCRQAVFNRIEGRRADFSGANLVAGRWRQVNVDEWVLNGAHTKDLQRVACSLQAGALLAGKRPLDPPGPPDLPQGWHLEWMGHGSDILDCAISADGHTLLTASQDRTARVWNRRGECLLTLRGHDSELNACAVSADGSTLLTASWDQTARVWNRQGECLLILAGHTEGVAACAVSADGQWMLTASHDHTARLWDRRGECLQVLRGHEDALTDCAMSADGQTLLTTSWDKTARLWNRQGECLLILDGHTEWLTGCAVSADGHTLLTASQDRTARVWNREGDCLLSLTDHKTPLTGCAMSADGHTLLTATGEEAVRLWNRRGECLLVIDGHHQGVITADGQTLLTVSYGTAGLWDRDGPCLRTLNGHEGGLGGCALSADGRHMLTASWDHTARLWNHRGECVLTLQGHGDCLTSCAISANGQTLLTASHDRTARVWSRQGDCLLVLKGHLAPVTDCAISADGKTMLTASRDKTARLWSHHGECLLTLEGHSDTLVACALSANGQSILTASLDKTARLWNRQGQTLLTLEGHEAALAACAMSADGQLMLTSSYDHTARLWDREGRCLLVIDSHGDAVTACAMSADGSLLLTASDDCTARLWNRRGDCLKVLKGHDDWLASCALSADGTTALTGDDARLRLWALEPARSGCLLELRPHTQTRVWLDQRTQALAIEGRDWPIWQLVRQGAGLDDPAAPGAHRAINLPGETLAELGPMAHLQLANADHWDFLPRDDMGNPPFTAG